MKLIFICAPYRSSNIFGIIRNIWKARKLAIKVWKAGHIAICPHLNSALFSTKTGIKEETFLKGDLRILARCDAICIKTGRWSGGMHAEVEHAHDYGIEVIHEHELGKTQ